MESLSLGGRAVPGFGVGEVGPITASTAGAALMVGATVGLIAHLFKAPLPVAVLAGTGGAMLAKYGIDRATA